MTYSIYHKIVIIASIIVLPVFCGVQVIPERAKVVYMNEKYFYNYSFNIRRYSRRSGYNINVEATLKRPWYNNVTFNLVFYEFLHNEYRRSFVELHYNFCDFLKNEKFIAPIVKSYGIKCPVPVGTYRFANMTVPLDTFPDVFPFEKTRMDVESTCGNESMMVGTYRFSNMSVPLDTFPDVFPFEKARLDVEYTCVAERMILVHFYANFKNKVR